MDRIQIKENAKTILKRNQWLCVAVSFIMMLGTGASGGAFSFAQGLGDGFTEGAIGDSQIPPFWEHLDAGDVIIAFIVFIATIAIGICLSVFVFNQFKVGGARFFLKFRRNMPVDIGEIFQSYRDKTFLNVAKVTFIKQIIIEFMFLLCFIPGIFFYYSYWAVDYILAVRPDINYSEAISLSKRLMTGRKYELFTLQISFVGWYILGGFTCGILNLIYVEPYFQIAMAEFYTYARESAISEGTINENDVPDYSDYFGNINFTFNQNNVNNNYNNQYNDRFDYHNVQQGNQYSNSYNYQQDGRYDNQQSNHYNSYSNNSSCYGEYNNSPKQNNENLNPNNSDSFANSMPKPKKAPLDSVQAEKSNYEPPIAESTGDFKAVTEDSNDVSYSNGKPQESGPEEDN